VDLFADVLAAPLWAEIDQMAENDRKVRVALRQVYGSLLMNGPFAIIVAHEGEVIALTDRVRLRPMVAATKGNTLYLSSEESAIRLICPQLDQVWVPMGGEPVIGRLGQLPQPMRVTEGVVA
jgi:glutamate synthase domain-containing protein 1